jgi:RimJ/RimL family protein N-acetyltransferase
MVETGRLLLGRWSRGDLEAYVRICADPEVMRYIGDGATLWRGQEVAWYAIDRRGWSS